MPDTLKRVERALRDHALALPETDEAFPWGERALRVKGKAFVFMRLDPETLSFSVKLPLSRKSALALPFVSPTHYGLGKHGWVTVTVAKPSVALIRQFKDWIDESYRSVAPKPLLAAQSGGARQTGTKRRAKRAGAST